MLLFQGLLHLFLTVKIIGLLNYLKPSENQKGQIFEKSELIVQKVKILIIYRKQKVRSKMSF